MPRYRVLLHGRNFRVKMEGKWQKQGFYTRRFADAPDSMLAAQVAMEEFRHTKKYQDLVEISLNGADDPSELCAEEKGRDRKKSEGRRCYRSRQDRHRGDSPRPHACLVHRVCPL